MKILVFGSNGLVGSAIKRLLSNSDYQEKYNTYFSTRNDTDLLSKENTSETIKNFEPDVLINAAAKVGGILANNTERYEFISKNLKINLNIFDSCVGMNNLKIINLGSSCIYPLNADNPIKEEYIMSGKLEPTNSPYAMAKLSAIELGSAFKKNFDNTVVNLMPTNLYGPNDNFSKNESHVIPGLISRMTNAKNNNEKTFTVWGTGEPLREFLHVDDLAKAIMFVLENNIENELINVGSNKEISIKNLVLIIQKIIGFDGEIVFDNSYPDGNPRKLLDSTKLFKLGWEPKISLEDGLQNTYKWYLENSKS